VTSANRPKQREDLLFRMVGEEGIVFDPKTNTTHALNRTSLEVWKLCDGHHTREEISDALSGMFDVSRRQIVRDVETLLNQFDRLHLLANSQGTPET